MTIQNAIIKRIAELREEQKLSGYRVTGLARIPASTYKSIVNGKSKNPGIVNIHKIASGLGISIREFYDSDLFDLVDSTEE